jgi:enoyl-CoA hydratase
MTLVADHSHVLVERDGAAVRITLNRPEALNSASAGMLTAVTTALGKAGRDDGVQVIVLTGAGRAFCSGADIGGDASNGGDDTLAAANRTVLAIRNVDKPVLAAVNGLAAGVGVSLAAACDLAVAIKSAYFLLAFTNIGLMPDGGATALIPAAVGRARAMRMALLAERITAAQAAEWGLISHVADDEAFTREVDNVIACLSVGPPLAYARTKRAINDATIEDLACAIDRETVGQEALVHSKDFREGVAAFRERRQPTFTGA